MKLNAYLGIILFLFSLLQQCEVNPDFNYEQNPKLPYSFSHLELDLTIEPDQEVVRGVATYDVIAKLPSQKQIILHAAALEIDAVTFEGVTAEHSIAGDSLIILLSDTLSMDVESKLSITWQGRSAYGTHKDRHGTMWSSFNPKALRNWLPVYDHPRVEFTVNADITVPAQLDVIFNGRISNDEITSADEKTVSWKVEKAIPATGLHFAVGNFSAKEAQSGIQKVGVFSESNILSETAHQQLLTSAIQFKKQAENALSFEYPWDALTIVVLEDDFWDIKNHGAGIIYLSKERGSLNTQLQRGLIAQWFGEYQRTEVLSTELELIKKAAFNEFGYDALPISNPDSLFTITTWNQLNTCCSLVEPFLARTIESSLSELIKKESGVVKFDFYSDYWYEQTGIPFPEYEIEKFETTTSREELLPLYNLKLVHDEVNSKAVVYFESVSSDGEDLQSLEMSVFTFDDTTSTEVTFTGDKDSVVVNIPMTTEYITFTSASTSIDEIRFGQFPVMFLLAQLRSEDMQNRKLAAALLSEHTDNPDLQLALRDALDTETDTEVKANLLRTLGAFTDGATGTELLFMKEVNNDSEDIQIAALNALGSYTEDESIPGLIQQKMEVTLSPIVFDTAKESFLKVADLSRKITVARRLSQIDTTGVKAISLLEEIIIQDTTAQSQQLAEQLLSFEYPYSTRYGALNLLLTNVSETDFWGNKVVELSSDMDPRIRLHALKGLSFLPELDAVNILEAIKLSEFDPRVLRRMKELTP